MRWRYLSKTTIFGRITAQGMRAKYGLKFTQKNIFQRNAGITHSVELDRVLGKEKLWIQSKITE